MPHITMPYVTEKEHPRPWCNSSRNMGMLPLATVHVGTHTHTHTHQDQDEESTIQPFRIRISIVTHLLQWCTRLLNIQRYNLSNTSTRMHASRSCVWLFGRMYLIHYEYSTLHSCITYTHTHIKAHLYCNNHSERSMAIQCTTMWTLNGTVFAKCFCSRSRTKIGLGSGLDSIAAFFSVLDIV